MENELMIGSAVVVALIAIWWVLHEGLGRISKQLAALHEAVVRKDADGR